ncbi:MAG: flagellar biosynthesis protein FlgE, partial [Rhizobiales bacterium]|nr:flagellar biosynthesis protein FlgE [Hyphomicrobiales bacterium]
MGIFGALNNAVSGLQSQAYALEQISGNIANSQTVGYKRAETSFADMVADAAPSRQA